MPTSTLLTFALRRGAVCLALAAVAVALVLPRPAEAAARSKSERQAHAPASKGKATRPAKAVPPKAAKAGKAAPKATQAGPRVRTVLRAQRSASVRRVVVAPPAPPRLSYGQVFGLHDAEDPLELRSSVALVIDQDTDEVLFSKNAQAVLPIASITKLMTAMVVSEARQPLDEVLTVSQEDVDTEKFSGSRLAVGTQLTRGEMLHLALMSSENRAAHALGRHHPGGVTAFVAAMNAKARLLGMHDTRYVEPTGLSSRNQSSAKDLARLVRAASAVPLVAELSVSPEVEIAVGSRMLQFRNTNGLLRNPEWAIGLQKTGYISEAGRCVVMQAQLAGRKLIMVLLDSAGRYSRMGDAERLRKWLLESPTTPLGALGTVGSLGGTLSTLAATPTAAVAKPPPH